MNVSLGDPLYRPYAAWKDPVIGGSANIWRKYRQAVLGASGSVIAAAPDLQSAAASTGSSMFLESLGAAQADGGDLPGSLRSVNSALAMKNPPLITYRLSWKSSASSARPASAIRPSPFWKTCSPPTSRGAKAPPPAVAKPLLPRRHSHARPRAMTDRYGQLRAAARCRETPDLPPTATELELQARFHRGDLGTTWTSRDGRRIELLHSGHWNREPGPDFRDARLLIDGAEVRGDIEIDLADRDWEGPWPRRKSRLSLRRSARLFPGERAPRLHPRLRPPRGSTGRLSADPVAPDSRPLTPAPPLDESRAIELVESPPATACTAGRRVRTAARLTDRDDALFQALATGLGYRNNKIPFLLIAQRATLARCRTGSGEALPSASRLPRR